jgi:hypothetical protein
MGTTREDGEENVKNVEGRKSRWITGRTIRE